MATNLQVTSLANALSVERDHMIQFVAYSTHDVDETSLQAAYVTTDNELEAVRTQQAWPTSRPGDFTHNNTHLDSDYRVAQESTSKQFIFVA